jgi:23S rRNA pseudouridine2605 synthase
LKGEILAVTPSGGEGSNRWLQVEVTELRPRDLRLLFEGCGLEANRILRTRLGPLAMDRSLARGRSRALTDGELRALSDAALPRTSGSRSPGR